MKTNKNTTIKNNLLGRPITANENSFVLTIPLSRRYSFFSDKPQTVEKKPSKITLYCLQPAKWVKGQVLAKMTGYSLDAQKHKRVLGIWIEGVHWRRAPDGNILYCLAAVEAWVEGCSYDGE